MTGGNQRKVRRERLRELVGKEVEVRVEGVPLSQQHPISDVLTYNPDKYIPGKNPGFYAGALHLPIKHSKAFSSPKPCIYLNRGIEGRVI